MIRIRNAGRQEYYQRLQIPLKLELLTEAAHRRDKHLLTRALAEAEEAGVSEECEEYIRCKRELQVTEIRESLKQALRDRDVGEIRRLILIINNNPAYLTQLQHDVIDAEREADRLERLLWSTRSVLYMDKKAMSELRRYFKPPKHVHPIMKGVMLLFKLDEEASESWKLCQLYLNPYGPEGMNRKVVDFDESTVHPEIAARVRQILDKVPLEKIQQISPALATFYVWALGVVDNVEKHNNSQGMEPANLKRQKDIFHTRIKKSADSQRRPFCF